MSHPREEIQATLERFVEANRLAEQDGNWERLAAFFTEDAVYVYAGLAANGMVEARGRDDFSPLWSGARPGTLAGLDAAQVTRRLMGVD